MFTVLYSCRTNISPELILIFINIINPLKLRNIQERKICFYNSNIIYRYVFITLGKHIISVLLNIWVYCLENESTDIEVQIIKNERNILNSTDIAIQYFQSLLLYFHVFVSNKWSLCFSSFTSLSFSFIFHTIIQKNSPFMSQSKIIIKKLLIQQFFTNHFNQLLIQRNSLQ